MSNTFKPISITYDSVLQEIQSKLATDPRFSNFRESGIAQITNEIFSSVVDLCTYALERRSEENFLETCRIRGSATLLSRMLGYTITRSQPSQASVQLYFKDNSLIDPTKGRLVKGDKIQIPLHATFTYSGNNYILSSYFSHTLTQQDIDGLNAGNYSITNDDAGNTIDILQGDIKEQVIMGNQDPQIGQIFQVYKIDDTTFSNLYGSEDITPHLTTIFVGNNKERAFSIDRRSLINWDSIANTDLSTGNLSGANVNICLMRSNQDDTMDLLFGDGGFAAIGAQSLNDNIYVQYLSTLGSKSNQVGTIGKDITFSGKVYDDNGNSLASYVKFKLSTNIKGGADIEDINSIKANAPAIYYSLDRLVTKQDYINYLKSITTPFAMKNALAWGEQEECRATGVDSIKSLFNVVLFSCLGHLYQTKNSPFYPYTSNNGLTENSILDDDFEDDSISTLNSYFNMYAKNNTVGQLKEYNTTLSPYWVLQASATPYYTNYSQYHGTFGDVMNFTIYYTSDKYATSLSGTQLFNIYLSAVSPSVTSADLFSNFAFQIQQELRSIYDNRGTLLTNSNYGGFAFSNSVDCNFTDNKFVVSGSPFDSCYVTKIVWTYGITDLFNFGTNPKKYYKQINTNIVKVITEMNKRSQVTIKNVYITPIIQNFNIEGTVYINSLFDKADMKVKIEDAIYSWLDLNADFGVEIYKSNVVQIIEEFDGVKYADIRFVPETLRDNNDTSYFFTSTNSHLIHYDFSVYMVIAQQLALYLFNNCNQLTGTSGLTQQLPENITDTFNYYSFLLQSYNFSWNSSFTERTFLTQFVSNAYNALVIAGYKTFADSDDFTGVVSDIRKDLLYIIRSNMIDSQGNIAREVRNNSYFKGGFSMGMEICKLTSNLTYEYKNA